MYHNAMRFFLTALLALGLSGITFCQDVVTPGAGTTGAWSGESKAAVLHPPSYAGSACMFEKFEIGLQLPDSVRKLIDAFMRNGKGGINPFNPDVIDVSATVSKSGSSHQLANAFYMRDHKLQDKNRDGKQERVVRIATDFPWRIRHAFTEPGRWQIKVTARLNRGPEFTIAGFVVEANDCGKPGYLIVGTENTYNDHYLRYSHSGEGFFALGYNLNEDKTQIAIAHCTDSTYEYYKRQLQDLATGGGNYTRIWATPPMLGIEYEQLGNYATKDHHGPTKGVLEGLLDRQGMAFVFDKIIELAETNNVKVQLCLEASSFFEGKEWEEHNPYRKAFGYTSSEQFFSEPEAKAMYKKKLRYLIARYGYSSALASWEFFNEIDEVWKPFYGKSNADGARVRKLTREWHQEMGGYIKNELNHQHHPLTTSYSFAANFPRKGQMPWTLPEIDMVQVHKYSTNENNNVERFHAVNPYVEYSFKPWYSRGAKPRFKPVLLGEVGGKKLLDECNARTFRNRLWATAFAGSMGSGLSWGQVHQDRNDWKDIKGLATFLQDVDLLTPEWRPDRWIKKSTDNAPFEVYSLSSKDNRQAMGWVANRTYDWSNLKDSLPCIAELLKSGMYGEGRASAAGQQPHPVTGQKITIKNLKPFAKYNIQWFDPATGTPVSTSTHGANAKGRLRPIVPTTNALHAEWAFKAVLVDEGKTASRK